ncbi:MAG: two component transcriptional regulator, LytTR family [Verrucomicrobia bacterium]|nr:two component transcriptional regulator, LytTR family [Verrucomicrobiota bacterium]
MEAQGDYIKFHAGARSCLVRMTMKVLDAGIDPRRFLRVHRSAVVNLDWIEKICPESQCGYAVVLRDGTRIRISDGHRMRVRAFYDSHGSSGL